MRFFGLLLCALLLDGARLHEQMPLTRQLFVLASSAETDAAATNDEPAWEMLDQLALRARQEMRARPSEPPIGVLNDVVFHQFGYGREVDQQDLRFVLLPSVLKYRRGSCVGLGALYVALGEALGLEIHGVLLPGHLYVRAREGDRMRSVELLRVGEEMSAEWYRQRFPIAGGSAVEYEAPLSPSEFMGVVEYNVGQDRARAGHLLDAQHFYRRASVHFPAFAEAHASEAVVSHLLGDLEGARRAYVTAESVNPNLPGLRDNLGLLELERQRTDSR